VRLWPLALIGLLYEGVWLIIAALTFALSVSDAYSRDLADRLGIIWLVFRQLLVPLDLATPGDLFRQTSPGRQEMYAVALAWLTVALLVATVVYLGAIVVVPRRAARRASETRLIFGLALLFQLTLLLMPGILTTDLASYVVYGRIASLYQANPYVVPPSAFPDDPMLGWISQRWLDSPTVYGPLWTDLSVVIERLTRQWPPVEQVEAYRVLLNLVHLVNLGLVWWLLPKLSTGLLARDLLVIAWSPLLLLEIAGNGHNDGLAVLFMLLGVALLAAGVSARAESSEDPINDRAWLLAVLCLGLATLVKWVPALLLLYVGVAWLKSLPNHAARRRWLTGATVLLVVVVGLLSAPWLRGLPDRRAPATLYDADFINSVVDTCSAWFAAHVLDRSGRAVQEARGTARLLFVLPALLVFVVYVAFEARRVWRGSLRTAPRATVRLILEASTRTMLVFIIVASNQVQAWYFSWPLSLAMLLGLANTTARVALAYSLLFPLVAAIRAMTGNNSVDPLLLIYALLPLAALGIGRFWRPRWRLPEASP
jgi:hypothetical protein